MDLIYYNAYRLASEFLENKFVQKAWREPIKLFDLMGWPLISYNVFENPNLSTEAYTSYKHGQFFILYCSSNYKTRTNYNFHHETGHVIAAHPILYGDSLCKSCLDTEREFLETEATIIGRNVFLPAKIILYIIQKEKSKVDAVKRYLMNTYRLSSDYINVRFQYLEHDFANMIYPQWVEEEKVKEYKHFLAWKIKNDHPPFIKKYINDYKTTPRKLMGRYSFSLPLEGFLFEYTNCHDFGQGYGIEYEYTGIFENLEKYVPRLKGKVAMLKVYEYPEGVVNQVTDIILADEVKGI